MIVTDISRAKAAGWNAEDILKNRRDRAARSAEIRLCFRRRSAGRSAMRQEPYSSNRCICRISSGPRRTNWSEFLALRKTGGLPCILDAPKASARLRALRGTPRAMRIPTTDWQSLGRLSIPFYTCRHPRAGQPATTDRSHFRGPGGRRGNRRFLGQVMDQPRRQCRFLALLDSFRRAVDLLGSLRALKATAQQSRRKGVSPMPCGLVRQISSRFEPVHIFNISGITGSKIPRSSIRPAIRRSRVPPAPTSFISSSAIRSRDRAIRSFGPRGAGFQRSADTGCPVSVAGVETEIAQDAQIILGNALKRLADELDSARS